MKILKGKLLFILLTTIVISCVCAQEKNCVFDSRSITEDFLKINPNIKSYVWFDKEKVATILMKTGEYVFVKKWACTSYGMEAKKVIMFPSTIDENASFWRKKLLIFGKQFLDNGDFELYRTAVQSTDWAKGEEILAINSKFEINIPNSSYPEFYVIIKRNRDMIVMIISYYMN